MPSLLDQILADPDPVRRENALKAYRELEIEKAKRAGTIVSGSQKSSRNSSAGTAEDIQSAVEQALRNMGVGKAPTVDDIRKLAQELMPPAPPPIDLAAAQNAVLQALNPLIASTQEQLERQFAEGLRALQAQQAASGIFGDPAQRRLEAFQQERARAINSLLAEAQAQAVAQALNLIGAQQGRYATQREAEQAAINAAINAYNVLGALQAQRAGDIIRTILGSFELQEQARQANLPYELPTQGTLLDFFLQLLRMNPEAFRMALERLG